MTIDSSSSFPANRVLLSFMQTRPGGLSGSLLDGVGAQAVPLLHVLWRRVQKDRWALEIWPSAANNANIVTHLVVLARSANLDVNILTFYYIHS